MARLNESTAAAESVDARKPPAYVHLFLQEFPFQIMIIDVCPGFSEAAVRAAKP